MLKDESGAVLPIFVEIFALIVGSNCLITGTLLLCYVFFHSHCYGRRFQSIWFVFDTIGNVLYTASPILYDYLYNQQLGYSHKNGFLLGLANFHYSDAIMFLGCAFAAILIVFKTIKILNAFDPVSIQIKLYKYKLYKVNFKPFLPIHTQNECCSYCNKYCKLCMCDKCNPNNNYNHKYNYKKKKKPKHKEKDDDSKQWQHKWIIARQSALALLGSVYIVMGSLILVLFASFYPGAEEYCNNYYSKQMVNDSSNTNFEMIYYSSCSYQVYPLKHFVDSDIFAKNEFYTPDICDCRYLHKDFSYDDYINYNFNYDHISAVLTNFNAMTQLSLSITSKLQTLSANDRIAITAKHLKSLRNARVLVFDSIFFDKIDSKLRNLELFKMNNHKCSQLPFISFGKLTKIKNFDVGESLHLTNITNDICHWKEIRSFRITSTGFKLLPQCIADKWKQIKRIEIIATPNLVSIPKNVFKLPNLLMFIAVYSGIKYDGFEFTNKDNIDRYDFSLRKLFLQQSEDNINAMCNNLDKVNNETLYFLKKFGACDKVCDLRYQCTPYDWRDGVCDTGCDTQECGYDGGDCNQLCLNQTCNYNKWGNGVCDQECNNTQCDYDFGDCGIVFGNSSCFESKVKPSKWYYGNDTNDYDNSNSNFNSNSNSNYDYNYDNNYNQTYFDCPSDWLDDGWCDGNCYNNGDYHNDSCISEKSDCYQCPDLRKCYYIYNVIITNVAAIEEPIELVTLDELCSVWTYVSLASSKFNNCSQAFEAADINNNQYVGFYEAILLVNHDLFQLSHKKVYQIDCSTCLANSSIYYY